MDAVLFETDKTKLTFKELKLILEVGTSLPKFMIKAKMEYRDENIGAVNNNILKFEGKSHLQNTTYFRIESGGGGGCYYRMIEDREVPPTLVVSLDMFTLLGHFPR